MGTPSHLGHMDWVAATLHSQAHAGAAQEAPDIGQWEGQDVPLVRPSSCSVKGGIPSSRRYLPTYLVARTGATPVHTGAKAKTQVLYLCEFHGNSPTNMKGFYFPIDRRKKKCAYSPAVSQRFEVSGNLEWGLLVGNKVHI